ncbi:GNAT family N-acetyltransferase [Glycomyces tenuis]|uniref:GNAT family N-acetyltransferase n=1 Tax=Glycomyces tenuis TaxID=58116 RepID=UPI00047B01B7|nr:GNAT family N-acetyltransferase [Glycomyces tenuis]
MRTVMRLDDGTVSLTPLGPDDLEAHLAGEDEELVRWLSGGPADRDGLLDYLRACERMWIEGGPMHNFGVRCGPEAVLAGTMDVQFDQPYLPPGEVNLSYGLYPAWRGRGVATRAVVLACDYATALGAEAAVIRCEAANRRSAAVAERAGFEPLEPRLAEDGDLLDWYRRALIHQDRTPSAWT